ncbi:hypothetical protein AUP68_05984 [Ilyonectria robusta]
MPAESVSLPPSASPQASSGEASDYTRLHISPLDPELLRIVLPAAVAPKARNISYHSIETFPERRYGYVEIPTMDADKLKKKLHGSVLKGTKLRVEKARPEKRTEPTTEADKAYEEEEERKEKRKSKKYADALESKKRKRDPDLIQGVAISDRKSKYTEKEECLLKTTLPPNAVANATGDNLPKKRKKRSNVREVMVHEFEKTTKFPSFLKDAAPESQSKAATEFVEGKGWVDADGNVVETVKAKPVVKPAASKPKKSKPVVEKVVEESDDDSTSSSGTSSSGSSDEESEDEEVEAEVATGKSVPNDDSLTQPEPSASLSAIKPDNTRPMSSSSSRSLTIKIPPPLTPSATKDLEWRSTRSAAPTPDTAHPSRMRNFWAGDDDDADMEDDTIDDIMDDEQGEDEAAAPAQPGSTEFQSWFWDNRRDLNRSWMSRRKTASKEKRHRDNKARASKAPRLMGLHQNVPASIDMWERRPLGKETKLLVDSFEADDLWINHKRIRHRLQQALSPDSEPLMAAAITTG